MTSTDVLAAAAACSIGMLSALYFVVWRAMRFKWAALACGYFLLLFILVTLDPYMMPVGDRPNPISTLIAQSASVLLVLGMNDFVAMPQRLARFFRGVAVTTAVVTTLLVALQWATRLFAFSAIAFLSLILAAQAWIALRARPDDGMRLVFIAMWLYPCTLLASVLGWLPLPMLRYTGAVPVTLIGMALLMTGLLRAQGRSDKAERELRALNETLERRVEQRTLDLREAVRGLDQANAELTELNASRTRMMAAACHDLRQPTHALGLLAEVASDLVPAQARQPIEGIRQCSVALCNMLDQLLDLTQLESDRYKPALQHFSLEEPLQEMQVQFTPLARNKGIRLHVATSSLVVHTDRHLFQRILMNLLSNGIKYTVAGSVSVDVVQTGSEVHVMVTDTGPGIPADRIDDAFTDYVRLDDSARSDGLGIGLPIVRRAATLLGHELSLMSELGKGTRVILKVPLSQQQVQVNEPLPAVEGRGRLIGVVENDATILSAVTQLLRGQGFQVVPARDRQELEHGLVREGQLAPDLLISDMHLDAGQDGLSLIRELIQQPAWARTAFVLVTGDLDEAVASSASQVGAVTAYKPVQPRRLLRLLDQLLEERASMPTAPGVARA